MSASQVRNVVFMDEKMDQYIYLDILKTSFKTNAQKLRLRETFIFQKDKDPKHTAKRFKKWFIFNTLKQLQIPPQSPYLNLIEHM